MSVESYMVSGRRFFGKTDHEAALRDKEKIDELRKKYDFSKPKDVRELYSLMQSGAFSFETELGTQFDDQIYELNQKLPKEMDTQSKASKKEKKAKVSKKQLLAELDSYDGEMKKAIQAELKKQELKRRIIVIGFSLLAVCCFSYLGIYYYQNYRTMNAYEQLADIKGKVNHIVVSVAGEEEAVAASAEAPEVLAEYQTLLNKNEELIGWLKIDDTNIDYPVLQTSDNEYYLTHDFNQNYDRNGSIFLDSSCDIVKRSTNLILYGHHMQSGNMFGNLSKYSDEKYYQMHTQIRFDTIYEKGIYEIAYIFRSRIYNENDVVFKYYQFINADTEKEFQSNMNEMAKLSLYDTGVTPEYGDELITLSTCDYQETNGRFVVVARKITSEQ